MTSLSHILKDPPPTHVFELSEAGLACARVNEPKQVNFVPFEAGVLQVSPAHDNISQPASVLEAIRAAAPPNGHRKRRAALILPDYCARIAVLDFDNFPSDPVEQLALLRFRMKKSVPFDVDSAIVSYSAQPRKKDKAKIEVLAAVMANEIVGRYEAPFRSLGFHPGLVITSSLAALNLMQPGQVTMLVKLNGRILTVLVLDSSIIKLARCVEMDSARPEDVESQTADYVERWQAEWGVTVEVLEAKFGTPGPNNAGLLGYLESVAG
jgi:type IV pilus assembly protein PilM